MHMKPFYESSLFLNHYWGHMNHWVCQTCTLIRRRTRPGSRQTEWIGNPSARRCSNAVGSFLMNSMWTLGRTRPTVEKHACCFSGSELLRSLEEPCLTHLDTINWISACFAHTWSGVWIHWTHWFACTTFNWVSIVRIDPNWSPGIDPPMPKMLRNRNRVLPRDEIRQAASQAKQLSEIQFQGFSLVAWSGTFHIKFYCSARTKLVCILMEALY